MKAAASLESPCCREVVNMTHRHATDTKLVNEVGDSVPRAVIYLVGLLVQLMDTNGYHA